MMRLFSFSGMVGANACVAAAACGSPFLRLPAAGFNWIAAGLQRVRQLIVAEGLRPSGGSTGVSWEAERGGINFGRNRRNDAVVPLREDLAA